MEAEILVEDFKCNVELYVMQYSTVIVVADNNIYKQILKNASKL